MKKAVFMVLMVGLSGCGPSREELARLDADTCESYGAAPGSQAYMQCRMMRDQQHNDNAARRQAAVQSALSNWQASVNASRPVTMAPRTCVSRPMGNQVITDCQ